MNDSHFGNSQEDNTPVYDDPFAEEDKKTRRRLFVMGGIGIVFCLLAVLGLPSVLRQSNLPIVEQYFPPPTFTATRPPTSTSTPSLTNTPSSTPTITFSPTNSATPTLSLTPTLTRTPTFTSTPYAFLTPPDEAVLIHDTFDSNRLNWSPYLQHSTFEFKDSKMYLRSKDIEYVALALCKGCPLFDKAFYFQAEVAASQRSAPSHGIAFCASYYADEFYVFQVDPSFKQYSLMKSTVNDWELLIDSTSSKAIKTYPEPNALGVRFEQGKIDLYINGSRVKSYSDINPISCVRIGLFINGGPGSLIADNVFAYKIKIATPTPLP